MMIEDGDEEYAEEIAEGLVLDFAGLSDMWLEVAVRLMPKVADDLDAARLVEAILSKHITDTLAYEARKILKERSR